MNDHGYEREVKRGSGGFPAFLTGLLFGGFAGAFAMWLLAPRTGKSTRSQLMQQGQKLRNQAVDGMDEVVGDVGAKTQHLTDGVQKQVRGVQQHAQEMLHDIKK